MDGDNNNDVCFILSDEGLNNLVLQKVTEDVIGATDVTIIFYTDFRVIETLITSKCTIKNIVG